VWKTGSLEVLNKHFHQSAMHAFSNPEKNSGFLFKHNDVGLFF
jgi:hypothetical protein